MRLLKRGAEGDLFESTWNQKRCVIKERRPKAYRNPQLDYRIRRGRTIRESEIIRQVKALGIRAPLVYFADAARCRLYLQYVDGPTVQSLPAQQLAAACREHREYHCHDAPQLDNARRPDHVQLYPAA